MSAPANYDQAELDIEPADLKRAAETVNRHARDIAGALNRINAKLRALNEHGWQGATQQEAEDFNTRWIAVTNNLFGPKDDPHGGVLNAIAVGIDTAYGNYNTTETELTKIWKEFSGKLPSASGGGDGKPDRKTPPDVTDTNRTAITADY